MTALKFKDKISLSLSKSSTQSKYRDHKLTKDEFMTKQASKQASFSALLNLNY